MKYLLSPRLTLLLIALEIAVLLPFTSLLPLWIYPFIMVIACWRYYGSCNKQYNLGLWPKIMILLLLAGLIFYQFQLLTGAQIGLILLIISYALKLFESRLRRDVVISLYLSYFLIITYFVYDDSLYTLLYALLMIWVTTVALISIGHLNIGWQLKKDSKRVVAMLLQALPVMTIMFIFFPRLPAPLWSLPESKKVASSGISEQMSPGSISELANTNDIAFRVHFNQTPPVTALQYWRVYVFDVFDGDKWFHGNTALTRPMLKNRGESINYEVTMEAHQQQWLASLDMPVAIDANYDLSSDYLLSSVRPIDHRIHYKVRSYPSYQLAQQLSIAKMKHYLQLPAQGNEYTRRFAVKLRAEVGSDPLFINQVLNYFRTQSFVYTLTPALLTGVNRIDDFLFSSRQGFCEHYAGAFAFMLRAAGIPSRVVTGFHGGELNPLNNDLVVRQYDAHAWVEAWLSGRGWLRIDPTAAVAAQRIALGMQRGIGSDPFLGRSRLAAILPGQGPLSNYIRYSLDLANTNWNEWILGYNRLSQRAFFRDLGLTDVSLTNVVLLMLASVFIVLLVLSILLLLKVNWQRESVLVRDYRRLCNHLASIGVARYSFEGPIDYAQRIALERPELATTVTIILEYYAQLVYGKGEPSPSKLKRFHDMVVSFKHPSA